MAVTYKDMLNRVLRTLGEEEVPAVATSLTEDYHKLVGNFLNQIKEEIEDAHNWRSLRQTLTASVAADALSGTITNSNERSRLVRILDAQRGQTIPLVFDTTDADNPTPLHELDLAELLWRDQLDPTTRASDDVSWFAIDDSSGDELAVYVWPRPNSIRTITITLVVPQARLTDTDVDTSIIIPSRALEVGTLWYALEERGEELGINALFSEERFRKALDDAISRDAAEQGGLEVVPV